MLTESELEKTPKELGVTSNAGSRSIAEECEPSGASIFICRTLVEGALLYYCHLCTTEAQMCAPFSQFVARYKEMRVGVVMDHGPNVLFTIIFSPSFF